MREYAVFLIENNFNKMDKRQVERFLKCSKFVENSGKIKLGNVFPFTLVVVPKNSDKIKEVLDAHRRIFVNLNVCGMYVCKKTTLLKACEYVMEKIGKYIQKEKMSTNVYTKMFKMVSEYMDIEYIQNKCKKHLNVFENPESIYDIEYLIFIILNNYNPLADLKFNMWQHSNILECTPEYSILIEPNTNECGENTLIRNFFANMKVLKTYKRYSKHISIIWDEILNNLEPEMKYSHFISGKILLLEKVEHCNYIQKLDNIFEPFITTNSTNLTNLTNSNVKNFNNGAKVPKKVKKRRKKKKVKI